MSFPKLSPKTLLHMPPIKLFFQNTLHMFPLNNSSSKTPSHIFPSPNPSPKPLFTSFPLNPFSQNASLKLPFACFLLTPFQNFRTPKDKTTHEAKRQHTHETIPNTPPC